MPVCWDCPAFLPWFSGIMPVCMLATSSVTCWKSEHAESLHGGGGGWGERRWGGGGGEGSLKILCCQSNVRIRPNRPESASSASNSNPAPSSGSPICELSKKMRIKASSGSRHRRGFGFFPPVLDGQYKAKGVR
jgi:hypothetical protein